MKILPWLIVLILLAGGGALYSGYKKQAAELTQLRQERDQLRFAARETPAEKPPPVDNELIRLRKENEDLLRLRNEVRQLRDEKKQLTQQPQGGSGQSPRVAQLQTASPPPPATATGVPAPLPAGTTPNPGAQPAAPVAGPEATAACINNLRQIEGAKQQWALEKAKPANTLVSLPELTPYLKEPPTCPAGGSYGVNPVGTIPTCSIPGHVLTK